MRVPSRRHGIMAIILINVFSRGPVTYIRHLMFQTFPYTYKGINEILRVKEGHNINCSYRTLKYRNIGLSFFGTKPIKASNSTDSPLIWKIKILGAGYFRSVISNTRYSTLRRR